MKHSKSYVFIFFVSFVFTTSLIWFLLPAKESSENMYFRKGYDFRKLRQSNSDLDTVKIGEKLNIENFSSASGKSLSFSNERLLLLVAIDPLCPACKSSKDMVTDVRETAEKNNIAYYPVLIASNRSNIDVQKYVQELGFEDYFYWSSESAPPKSLFQSVTPSHILVSKDGVVLQAWYGSNEKKEIRKMISNQISSDILLIKDVVKVISAPDYH